MTRKERSENARKERMEIARTFVQAFHKGGLKEAESTLLSLKRQTPQRTSQIELAFRNVIECNIQRGVVHAYVTPA